MSSNGVNITVGETATPHLHLQPCQATDAGPLISPPALTDRPFRCTETAPIAVWAAHITAIAYHWPFYLAIKNGWRPTTSFDVAGGWCYRSTSPSISIDMVDALQRLYPRLGWSTPTSTSSAASSTIDAAPPPSTSSNGAEAVLSTSYVSSSWLPSPRLILMMPPLHSLDAADSTSPTAVETVSAATTSTSSYHIDVANVSAHPLQY